jgi:hypothetical protein
MSIKSRLILGSGVALAALVALAVLVVVLIFTFPGSSPATSDALYQKHRVAFDVLERRARELESFYNARWVIGEVEFGGNGAYARQHDGSWSLQYGAARGNKLTIDEMLAKDSLTVDEFNACQALIRDIPATKIEILASGDFVVMGIRLPGTPPSIWREGTQEGIAYWDPKRPPFQDVTDRVRWTKLDERWYSWQERLPRNFIAH